MSDNIEELDALIVGAGFAGVYQLDRLRGLGLTARIFEAGSELGGVWQWNCYPGARVDTEGPIYQFSRHELWHDWEYQVRYPSRDEVLDYFAHVDRKLGIRENVRFGARVTGADFDAGRNQWAVRTADGSTTRCTYLIPCTGFASKPYLPPIPGLSSFRGAAHHTARWPRTGLALDGQRVAVIGTGASGVQVIQEAARRAAELTVFQRTPNLALPMRQRTLSDDEQAAVKAALPARFRRCARTFAGFDFQFDPRNAVDLTPEERRTSYEALWREGGFRFWLAVFQDTLFNQESNEYAYAFWRDRVRRRIKDPWLAEKLAPAKQVHPFGAKRPSLEQNYFEAYNQDNVHLVDLCENPIDTVTEHGIRTADGTEHKFDIIVLATGFDAVSGGLTQLGIRATDGLLLQERWAHGVSAHLGMATAGFPNLLFVYGPQSPSGFCNGPTCAEVQGEMIGEILEHLLDGGKNRIESTPEADAAWTEHVAELAAATLFGKAKSWYMGSNIPGKPVQSLNYPGGLPLYRKKFDEAKKNGFAGFTIS